MHFMTYGHNETLDESVTMETEIHKVFLFDGIHSHKYYTVQPQI